MMEDQAITYVTLDSVTDKECRIVLQKMLEREVTIAVMRTERKFYRWISNLLDKGN